MVNNNIFETCYYCGYNKHSWSVACFKVFSSVFRELPFYHFFCLFSICYSPIKKVNLFTIISISHWPTQSILVTQNIQHTSTIIIWNWNIFLVCDIKWCFGKTSIFYWNHGSFFHYTAIWLIHLLCEKFSRFLLNNIRSGSL